ncbi:arginyl-tRNA--protein transferase 2 isoform X1 [Triticum aestivum]|uniref:arginyl-tRNA--protein transferase 2 isoform X1 n=2 Tax=Triticinae TaxID=1648030 RepID=UPI0008429499|nr:arginyl-tRNA--protein transferase 2-like isoform X1 [Triticum aestivum]
MADGASSSGAGAGGRGGGGGESVVIDYGRRRTTCGYCRSTGPTSISHAINISDSRQDHDRWTYVWGSSTFTTHKYYSCFRDTVAHQSFRWLWKSKSTMKIKVFGWLLLSDRLNTRNMLKRRHYNIGDDHDCILCGLHIEETVEHLFFECQFTQPCWASFGLSWQQGGTRLQNVEVAKETWARPLFMGTFLLAAWSIWKERNNKHFRGLWANSLKADDYQALLDRGWRRSGSFLYKPEMERTCCPAYTIRLKASDFICSKEQDRVLKRMQRFLDGELEPQVGSPQCKNNPTKRSLNEPMNSPTLKVSRVSAYEFQTATGPSLDKEDEFISFLSSKINEAIGTCFQGGMVGSDVELPKAVVKTVKPQVKKKVGGAAQEKKGGAVQDLVYSCNISFQLAAVIKRALSEEKRAVLGDLSPNCIAERLVLTMEHHGEIAGFAVKACNGHLNFYSATIQPIQNHTSIDTCAQASDRPTSSKQSSVNKNDARHNKKARKLEFKMARSHFDPEEFALYQRYQTKVHKEKTVTESSYKRFLVDTPIVPIRPRSGDNTVPPCGFGSFHQQYRIDGKLVAVGVVDILPKCLSSKYLFWDPDLAFLSLGKYTALKEIDWIKTTQKSCPSLEYYYLGYYIHSCNKMRYKAAYRPSELLCPVRYEWVRYDAAKPLLDKSLYSVISDFSTMAQDEIPQPHACGPCDESSAKNDHSETPIDEDDEDSESDYDESDMMVDEEMVHSESKGDTAEDCSGVDVENVIMDLSGSRVKYKELHSVVGPIDRRHLSELERQLSRYAKVVGKELSDRIVYSLS